MEHAYVRQQAKGFLILVYKFRVHQTTAVDGYHLGVVIQSSWNIDKEARTGEAWSGLIRMRTIMIIK